MLIHVHLVWTQIRICVHVSYLLIFPLTFSEITIYVSEQSCCSLDSKNAEIDLTLRCSHIS